MAVTYTPALAAGLGSAPPVKGDVRGWLEAIATAINTQLDPRATPIYATRAAAVTAAPSLPGNLNHIVTREGTALVVRERSASADDPLFGTAPRWGVVLRQDVAAETAARIAAARDAGVLPLASVAGTANAITAVIDPALTGVTLSALSTVELIPAADNTGPATLNVGGAGAWPVQRGDGTPVEAGDLRAGVARHYRRVGSAWRMVGPANSETADPSAVMPLVLGGSGAQPLVRLVGNTQHVLSDLSEVPADYALAYNYPVDTWIITADKFDAAGRVAQLECFAKAPGLLTLGVWTATIGSMALRAQQPFTVVAGYNSFEVTDLDVRRGEVLAIRQSAQIIPATSSGSGHTEHMNTYRGQWHSSADTAAIDFDTTPTSARAHGGLWLATIQPEDGAGQNQLYRSGALAADWLLMSALISGRESSGYQGSVPAITSVEDSLTITHQTIGPLSQANFGPSGTERGSDNPFFHAIRCYKSLLQRRAGVRPTDFEHRVVASGFGRHGTGGGAATRILSIMTPDGGGYSAGAVQSKAAHRKVLPILIDLSGERELNSAPEDVRAMYATAHGLWRDGIAADRSKNPARVPDPFEGRAPIFMAQYCRFSTLRNVPAGQLLHLLSYPDTHIINPNYMIGIDSGSDRNPTLDGIKCLGAHIGWSMYRVLVDSAEVRPLMMASARVVGGRIVIETNGKDLISDQTAVPAQVNHGITLHNAAGVSQPISSVTIDGGRIIIDTIAPVAAGWTVRYGDAAMVGFDPAQAPTYGGNIRENPTGAFSYEGFPCVRWMAVHQIALPAPETASVVMSETDYAGLSGIYAPNTLYHLTEG